MQFDDDDVDVASEVAERIWNEYFHLPGRTPDEGQLLLVMLVFSLITRHLEPEDWLPKAAYIHDCITTMLKAAARSSAVTT